MSQANKRPRASSTSSSAKSQSQVCPITLTPIQELENKQKFPVCPDPTIYRVDALYHWIFGLHNDTYPHNRIRMSSEDKARLKRMWESLHPSPKSGDRPPSENIIPLPVIRRRRSPSNENVVYVGRQRSPSLEIPPPLHGGKKIVGNRRKTTSKK